MRDSNPQGILLRATPYSDIPNGVQQRTGVAKTAPVETNIWRDSEAVKWMQVAENIG
jgi:hypothetical protein